jgi:hypothetical protein
MQSHAPAQEELVRGPLLFFFGIKVVGDYWNRLLEEYHGRACSNRAGRSTSVILTLAPVKRLSTAFCVRQYTSEIQRIACEDRQRNLACLKYILYGSR